MTATADFMNADNLTDQSLSEPVQMAGGERMVLRALQRLLGASFVIAALGLWVVPGSSLETDLLLYKLILSITALISGAGLMMSSSKPDTPEIQVDLIRREVRLVRIDAAGASEILQRCAFDDLSQAEYDSGHVRLWDAAGRFIAEVSQLDKKSLASLTNALRDAGKLA